MFFCLILAATFFTWAASAWASKKLTTLPAELMLVDASASAAASAALPETAPAPPRKTTEALAVWVLLSPRMPYALHEWPRLARAAQRAGFTVRAWRDPRVPPTEWLAAVQASGHDDLRQAPVMPERYAQALGLLNHAPSSIVVRCGQAHPWPILGVMPDASWQQLLLARAAALEEIACPPAD